MDSQIAIQLKVDQKIKDKASENAPEYGFRTLNDLLYRVIVAAQKNEQIIIAPRESWGLGLDPVVIDTLKRYKQDPSSFRTISPENDVGEMMKHGDL